MASSAAPNITDEVEIGGTPGGNPSADQPTPPRPSITVPISAYAQREYVAGSSGYQWYADISRALPWALDDVARDFGADVYDRILLDPVVRANIDVLKSSILETGVELRPAIDDKTADGYEQAASLADEATDMLDELHPALDGTLWNMLDAVALGNKIAEQIYDLETSPGGTSRYTLRTLAVRPRVSVAFVVDTYLNVLGILARIPGQPYGVQQGMLLADLAHTPNILPRAKFAVLSFRPADHDPRGTSILRPCYSAWAEKQQVKREFLKYLTQFATPSLIGFTAPDAQPYQPNDASGNPAVDAAGNPIIRTPEEDMIAALTAFANGTAVAFPNGAEVRPIEMSGEGDAFLRAFAHYDEQITKSILLQMLATNEGRHQSRASSQIHKDVLDTVVRQEKRTVERMIERDVLRTWMQLNGRANHLDLCPKVTLGTAEQEDYASLWTAVAALRKADYLHESQYADLDQQVGLPEREPPNASTVPVTELITVKDQGDGGDDTGTPAEPATPATAVTTTTTAKPADGAPA